jgi:hypothetical protein
MAGSTIGVVQVVLSARDDSLAREFAKATKQISSFKDATMGAFKLMMGTEITRKVIRGLGEIVDYMTVTSDEARKMGVVIGEETRARLDVASESFKRMEGALNGVRVTIADSAAPTMAAFANMITGAAKGAGDTAANVSDMRGAFERLGVAVAKVGQFITTIMLTASTVIQSIGVAISAVIETVYEGWRKVLELVGVLDDAQSRYVMTSNTIAGLEATFAKLKETASGSWAQDFRDELAAVKTEMVSTATAAQNYQKVQASYITTLAAMRETNYARERQQDQERMDRWKSFQALTDPKANASFSPFVGDFIAGADNAAARQKALEQQIPNGFVGPVGQTESEIKRRQEEIDEQKRMELEFMVWQREEEQRFADERAAEAEAEIAREKEMQGMRLQAASDFFGNLATITASAGEGSKAMFFATKGLLMAQATINAWMAYSNVMGNTALLASLGGNTAAQSIMASTAFTAGMMAVGQIAKQQPAGRANGGPVSRGGLYQVNERGPEMLSIGDKSYLMMGAKDGRVTPNGSGPGRATQITVNIHAAPGTTATVENRGTERVDQAIAGGIRSGSSATARALQSTYRVNRASGAR